MALPTSHPTPTLRAPNQIMQQESDLVVAIFRTALIILAVLSPLLGVIDPAMRSGLQISVLAATLYNLAVVLLYQLRVRLSGQREIMVLIDVLLVTVWVYFTWNVGIGRGGSQLFPLYYVVVITGALWFGVSGALATAAMISVLFLLVIWQLSGNDVFAVIEALYRQIVYVFLVGVMAGYLSDTYQREREQWTRSQVLLAHYQERFRAAQEVYELLIPTQTPQVPSLEMAARWRPALREGGGDFYDVLELEDGRVVLTIADVSGKHMRGALKLPLFKAAFLAVAQVWNDPGQMLAQVNRITYPLLQPDMFISACIISIDPRQQWLSFANGGQDPPIFVHQQTRETVRLETGGLVLGVDQRAAYLSDGLRLEPGDTLCLYTDGITEARDPAGEEFGAANLEARVQAAVALGLSANEMVENIMEAVTMHMAGTASHDDITLVIVRYKPEGGV